MTDHSDRTITVKRSLDMDILGENISDIADFAVEKYEFRLDTTLSSEVKEAALKKTSETLWEMVERLMLKRQEILKRFFDRADETVNEVVSNMQE